MNVKEPKYWRARLNLIQQTLPMLDDKEKRLYSNGFIPTKHIKSFDKQTQNLSKEQSNEPLSFVELTSYSTWFAMHPEKIAGQETEASSIAFPIKLKGNKKDIEKMFASVFGDKVSDESEAEALAIALQLELELMDMEGLGNISEVNNIYNINVSKYENKQLPRAYIFKLGTTPNYLLKKGYPAVSIQMTQRVLKKANKVHKIPFYQLKDLPKILNSIKEFYNSDTVKDNIVAISKLQDSKGNPIVIILSLKKINSKLELYDIPSIYGRSKFNEIKKSWIKKRLKI